LDKLSAKGNTIRPTRKRRSVNVPMFFWGEVFWKSGQKDIKCGGEGGSRKGVKGVNFVSIEIGGNTIPEVLPNRNKREGGGTDP